MKNPVDEFERLMPDYWRIVDRFENGDICVIMNLIYRGPCIKIITVAEMRRTIKNMKKPAAGERPASARQGVRA